MEQYVAFLDILGFKDLVEKNSHEELERVYKNLVIPNTEHSLSFGASKVIDIDGERKAVADISKFSINSLIVSDSVILWTDRVTMKSFIDIVTVARNLLVQGIFCGIPMRGAISLGPVSFLRGDINTELMNGTASLIRLGLVKAYHSG